MVLVIVVVVMVVVIAMVMEVVFCEGMQKLSLYALCVRW